MSEDTKKDWGVKALRFLTHDCEIVHVLEIVPMNDEIEHVPHPECICGPDHDTDYRGLDDDGRLFVAKLTHVSLDGREQEGASDAST